MSRIGKNPIAIPKGVDVKVGQDSVIIVKGPKGQMTVDCKNHVGVKVDGENICVERYSDDHQDRAYHGLYQRLLSSMVEGVTQGFQKQLELVGVGYRAQMEGKVCVLNLGFSHDIRFDPPEGVTITMPQQTTVVVTGIDKQKVGQVAANIRALRPPEPYKGKGVRYTGEHVRRKVGKTGA